MDLAIYNIEDLGNSGATVVHFDQLYGTKLKDHQDGLKFYECRGDLCFITKDPDVATLIQEWSWSNDKHRAPRSTEDLCTKGFLDLVPKLEKVARLNLIARTAFPAEMRETIDEDNLPDVDYWRETDQYWIRQHLEPRQKLFTPSGTTGGPDTSHLTGRRLTKIIYDDDDQQTVKHEDDWTGPDAHKAMGKVWTGQTFFEKKPASEEYSDQQSLEELLEAEEDMLGSLPLPGVPKDERERRKLWTTIPQRIRAAIRRLQKQFGHVPRSVLISLVKAAKLPKVYMDAARSLKCTARENIKLPPQTHKVSLAKDYIFNHTVG